MNCNNFSFSLKNRIIKNEISLSNFNKEELHHWLISNFTNILSEKNIFINKISITPLENKYYKYLYLINAVDGDASYKLEFGELLNNDSLEHNLNNSCCKRLSYLNFHFNDINLSKLNLLKLNEYTLIKSKKIKTILIY